jgi:hypothetical protein
MALNFIKEFARGKLVLRAVARATWVLRPLFTRVLFFFHELSVIIFDCHKSPSERIATEAQRHRESKEI